MEDNKDIPTQVKKIPAFTVLKNGSILKNIFLLRKQSAVDKSSQNQESDEQILLVGRHPHCHITLGHPSISRHHLRIHSNPSLHIISVVDLSSVHGTYVSGKRIEPGVQVDLKEGDTVKMGGSTRVYHLKWVPVSQINNVDEQFVPNICTIKEGQEEDDESHEVEDEKHDAYSSDNDLEGSDVSISKSSVPLEDSIPLKTSNENDEPLNDVSIQAPLVASETISESEVSICLNKTEHKLNLLKDNMSNEFDQISYETITDDLVSIDCFDASETHEMGAINQDTERNSEIDFDNENGTENLQINNNGSVPVVVLDGVNTYADCEFEQIDQMKMVDESASKVVFNGVDTGVKYELVDHDTMKEESVFVVPDVTKLDQEKTLTPDILTDLLSVQNVSVSKNVFDDLLEKEFEFYTPDKENKNPNACYGKSLSKKAVSPTVNREKGIFGFSQNLSASDEEMNSEHKVDQFVICEEVLASSEKENMPKQIIMEGRCNAINYPQTVKKTVNSSQNLAKKRWTMVVDTNSLLDHKSLKHLKLLEGIKGTQLLIPKIVVNELMDIKSQDSFFKRVSKKASLLALKWIDECLMNTRWWIHVDDEIVDSLKSVPEVLEIAIHVRKEITDQKIIILSNNLTMKIKSMAEGIMCEAAEEFHESLVNPFSERFMWVGSAARGLTWSSVENGDDIMRRKYRGSGLNGSHGFKGLKLLTRVNQVTVN